MTRIRKVTAVGLLTPIVAAAIAVGMNRTADATEACLPLASASITPPDGTVTAGSTVHVTAQVNGLMLMQAHLQITGPGLDTKVGNSVTTGPISGDVTVPKPGEFRLAVIGNATKCTYQTADFTVKARASSAAPAHGSVSGRSSHPGNGSGGSAGKAGALPRRASGGGSAGDNYSFNPLRGASPYSLPQVAPDGSAQGFAYPTPEPQVASPPAAPVATNVSDSSPVNWGQSLAVALVLLIISAHLGMWSRRQRLAAEGARSEGSGRRAGRRRGRRAARGMTTTATAEPGTATDAPPTNDPAAADGFAAEGGSATADHANVVHDRVSTADDARADDAVATTGELPRKASSKISGGRGYRGRRRRS